MIGQASEDVLMLAIEAHTTRRAAAVVEKRKDRAVQCDFILDCPPIRFMERGSGDSFPGAYKGRQLCD